MNYTPTQSANTVINCHVADIGDHDFWPGSDMYDQFLIYEEFDLRNPDPNEMVPTYMTLRDVLGFDGKSDEAFTPDESIQYIRMLEGMIEQLSADRAFFFYWLAKYWHSEEYPLFADPATGEMKQYITSVGEEKTYYAHTSGGAMIAFMTYFSGQSEPLPLYLHQLKQKIGTNGYGVFGKQTWSALVAAWNDPMMPGGMRVWWAEYMSQMKPQLFGELEMLMEEGLVTVPAPKELESAEAKDKQPF